MLEPRTYRKKPVHVQAMQWDGTAEGATPIINWILENGGNATYKCSNPARCAEYDGDNPHWIVIETLEGPMHAGLHWWIIQGVEGEFYPCKPSVFAATYEEVDQDGNRVNSTQYPESANTPVMTVAAILEWLEDEKEDIEATRKSTESSYGALGTMTVNLQAETVKILIDNLTKSTFQQMDEAHGNE